MALDFSVKGTGGTGPTNASRNTKHQTLSYGDSTFQAAQAMGSKLLPGCKKVNMVGSKQLFDVEYPIEYDVRRGGILPTVFKTQDTERREMQMRHWLAAVVVSGVDEYASSLDLKMAFKRQLINAQGRRIDNVILNAIVQPAVREVASKQVDTLGAEAGAARDDLQKELGDVYGNDDLHYTSQVELLRKDNLYAAFDYTSSVASSLKNYQAANSSSFTDTLTDILHIFISRNVVDQPIITLTPELRRLMYKDKDFKDSDIVYNIGGTIDSLDGALDYMGAYFVRVQNDVLPKLGVSNIAYGVDAATITKEYYYVRDVGIADPVIEPSIPAKASTLVTRNSTATSIKTGAVALTIAKAQRSALNKSMVYCWIPSALYCSTSGKVKMKEGELQAYREDPYLFSQIPVSAMLIKETHALCFLLRGPAITEITAGSGNLTKAG